jgi:hypothetical protein
MLCDLSTQGAMTLTAGPLPTNEQVALRWSGFEALGTIQWSDDQLSGLSFAEYLPWEIMLAMRQEQDERGYSAQVAEQWVLGQNGAASNVTFLRAL